MMASHGIVCGPSFLSWRSASSFLAIVRRLKTIQRADNKRASGRFLNAISAAVDTKTTVTTRFQLAMNSTRVLARQRKELDSDRPRLFITTAKTPGLALWRTSPNRVARICVSSTFSCQRLPLASPLSFGTGHPTGSSQPKVLQVGYLCIESQTGSDVN